MSEQQRKNALVAVGLISFTWGTTWLPSKLAVAEYHMPPFEVGAMRFTLSGIIFLIYFFIKGYSLPSLKMLMNIAALSFVFLVVSNGLTLQGLSFRGMSSGIGAVLGATVPLWVALFSIFLLKKQKLTLQVILGLLLGFGGVVIIFAEDLKALQNPDFEWAILFLIIAAIAWSLGTLFNAKKDDHIDPFYKLAWQLFLCGVMMSVYSCLFEHPVPLAKVDYRVWLCVLYLIAVGSMFSFIAYIFALKHLPAAQVAVYAYINPIVALLLGFFWRNENLNWYIAIGAGITLLGVYLVNNAFNKQPEIEN